MTLTGPGPTDDVLAVEFDEAAETLERLLEVLEREEGLEVVLGRLARTALLAIGGADAVTVTVRDESGPRTVSATSAHVLPVDEVRYAAGEGPDLEAAVTRAPLRVSVAEVEERWPAFAEVARASGVRSFLSVPLVIPAADDQDEELVGSLNAYGHEDGAFAPVDSSLLQLLTAAAVAAVGNARRYLSSQELVRQLRTALVSRPVIEQAKGVLMAVHGVDADRAFAMLVRHSQRENLKLHEIAKRFLTNLNRSLSD